MADFEGAWQVLDAQVASGRIPGYVAALRVGGQVEVRAGVTKPMGGVRWRSAWCRTACSTSTTTPPMSGDEFVARVAGLPPKQKGAVPPSF